MPPNLLLAEHSLARGAELALLRLQARRDFVGVGNEFAAQAENVGGASLASFRRTRVLGDSEARGGEGDEREGDDCDSQHLYVPCV